MFFLTESALTVITLFMFWCVCVEWVTSIRTTLIKTHISCSKYSAYKTAVPIKIIRTGICIDLAIASVSDSGNVFCRTDF